MSSKNIKIIHNGNFPFGGASANYIRYFAQGLEELGNNVEVLLPTGHYFGKISFEPVKRTGEIKNVKYSHLGFLNHPKNPILKLIAILCGSVMLWIKIIHYKLKKKVDIIIKYNVSATTNISFNLLGTALNIKRVYILPEFYEKSTMHSRYFGNLKWWNFIIGIKYLIKNADGVIVLSHYLKNYVQNELSYKGKVLIVPNLTDIDIFCKEQSHLKTDSLFTIGYVGTPTVKDGIYDLLKAFQKFQIKNKKTKLVVIGDITNGNTVIDKLKAFTNKMNVENIEFTGLVPFQKVPEMLNACDLLALTRPSGIFAEAGFPTKLGEYFSTKKPVLITKVGDIPKYFTNMKQVVLVNPGDIDGIVRGFEFIFKNPEKAEEIGLEGYRWVRQNLYYKNVAPKIMRFFSAIEN